VNKILLTLIALMISNVANAYSYSYYNVYGGICTVTNTAYGTYDTCGTYTFYNNYDYGYSTGGYRSSTYRRNSRGESYTYDEDTDKWEREPSLD
jgi:hypothetical protein